MTSLQEELGRIAGVAEAAIEASGDGPVGIRITVDRGFDQSEVAKAVRELLAMRGLTSALADPVFASPPSDDASRGVADGAKAVLGPPRQSRNGGLLDPVRRNPPGSESGPGEDAGAAGLSNPDPSKSVGPAADEALRSSGVVQAAVSESAKGVEVAVKLANGSRGIGRGGASAEGMYRATADAVYEATGRQGAIPTFQAVERLSVEGHSLEGLQRPGGSAITAFLERDGTVVVGSAMVGGTEVLAIARAVWVALRSG